MKKILTLVLALVMMLSLVACNNDKNNENDGNENKEPEKVTYTVTVVDQDGNPVAGAKVAFATKGGTAIPFTTDATGKLTYKSSKEITATVAEIPVGYEYSKTGVAQSFTDGSLTVTLTKLAPFVIKVVDETGAPISGVKVQMCDVAGSCRMPVTTDAEGIATYDHEDGEFHAQLTALPEGYTVEDISAYYDFVNKTATITLTKIAE